MNKGNIKSFFIGEKLIKQNMGQLPESSIPLYNSLIMELTNNHNKSDIIKIFINDCPGGQVSSAFSIIDCIKNADCQVYTYSLGMNSSCGALMFMAGHKRFMYSHSELMFHRSWINNTSISYDNDRMKEVTKKLKSSDNYIKEYLTNKIPDKYIYKIFKENKQVYFNAKKALKYKLIDEIL